MSLRTSRVFIVLRRFGRALGVNAKLVRVLRGGYENRFQEAMLSAVRPGDCVWDVGANIGYYTLELARRVGSAGSVVAFEPSPNNLERLRAAVAGNNQITVMPCALGAKAGKAHLRQGADPIGATSQLVESEEQSAGAGVVSVTVQRGDDLVDQQLVPAPCVVKIDTEGFEVEVLEGMSGCLASRSLRALCIEIHFGLLTERGLSDAPARIERMLQAAGFRCRWTDLSHIVATRI